MIRVDLLGRQRRWSPWSKALLSALVVCGGLYGIHLFFPALAGSLFSADSTFSPAAQQEQEDASSPVVQREIEPKPTAQEAAPSPVVPQESTPDPTAQQEAASSSAGQREITPKSVAQRDTVPSSVVQQEATSSPVVQQESTKPVAQQETTPKPVVVQRETIPSPGMQQETTPSPVQEIEPKPATRQEVAPSSAAQQDTLPSPVAQQETASSPVQEAPPNPVREPVVQSEASPSPSTPSQAPAPQRSTACHQVMRIDEQVPAGIRVASLNCNSSGEFWLEGTSPSHKVLREFRLSLKALPSRVSFSTWREERTLRFAVQGRFADQDTPPLDALSSDQAEQFFGKVARWADASGLDSLSIHKPIHWPLSPTRSHQRQKLRGIGSPQQIDAFLQQLQQAEAVATLGEVLLLPVKSDEHGWVQARLYAAVDIIVDGP